jgi:hypothetical protein
MDDQSGYTQAMRRVQLGNRLVAHGLSVFGIGGMLGPEWEQKKIKEIMKKKREE